ncbi:hypothetical protein [Noviherbaspirillum sedimenti]|uniref:hypothetical protein n=1 Tax=Noviherbaspirillum sedimenti TaxID=2320865 RepID=UPI0018F57AA1|nr:hypothetical protein [Noviherbaspirillum sedimenti]
MPFTLATAAPGKSNFPQAPKADENTTRNAKDKPRHRQEDPGPVIEKRLKRKNQLPQADEKHRIFKGLNARSRLRL